MTHADNATLSASRPRSDVVRSGVMARNIDNAKNGVVKKKYFNSVSTKSVIIFPASCAKSENTFVLIELFRHQPMEIRRLIGVYAALLYKTDKITHICRYRFHLRILYHNRQPQTPTAFQRNLCLHRGFRETSSGARSTLTFPYRDTSSSAERRFLVVLTQSNQSLPL